jgi:hypothetical protein
MENIPHLVGGLARTAAKRVAELSQSSKTDEKGQRIESAYLILRKAYYSTPDELFTVEDLDDMYEEFGVVFNKHVLAMSHASHWRAGYLCVQ